MINNFLNSVFIMSGGNITFFAHFLSRYFLEKRSPY